MSEDDGDGIDRRRLVRILIVVGIGVPILIEAVTFFGLVSHSLGGDDGGDATPTPSEVAVGVGDELLSETEPTERVTTATIGRSGGDWQFVFTVQVENTGSQAYELRLGAVRTTEGTVVEGSASTGVVDPGDDRPVTGTWSLPVGERPVSIDVSSVTHGQDGLTVENATVQLKPVPVGG